VLIISGSPMIGSYEFRSGIDFVRVPGVVKQIETGEYDSANLRVGVEHTMADAHPHQSGTARRHLSPRPVYRRQGADGACAARSCGAPPAQGARTPLVLGLARRHGRSGRRLPPSGTRKNVVPALRDLYDEIWIYGLPQINKPLTASRCRRRCATRCSTPATVYRDLRCHSDIPHEIEEINGPFILVTAGGGGDGADLNRLGALSLRKRRPTSPMAR